MPPITPVTLTDEGLLLRLPTLDDVAAVTAACQDPDVQAWTTIPVPYAESDAVWFLGTYVPAAWEGGTEAVWLVTDPADGTLLGCCGLTLLPEERGEVGFWIAPQARGRGVATAATRLMCRWGFQERGLQRIEWLAFVGNEPSRRVAEKAGFRLEGTCRARLVQRGVRKDAWLAGLLPTDLA